MAIAFDAATNLALGSGDRAFNHTPVGTPRGVVVTIADGVGTDQVVGVTYGGVAMVEVPSSPIVLSSGEGGAAHAFFLGAAIPTGLQSVSIDRGDATNYGACCYTVTAAADTEVHDTKTTSATAVANPSVTLVITKQCYVCGCLYSGQNALTGITPGTGLRTSGAGFQEIDFGTDVGGFADATSLQSSNFAYSWTQASEDAAMIAVAIAEKAASLVVPPMDAWTQNLRKR